MKTQDIKNMGLAMQQVQEAEVDRFTMAPRVKGPGATDSKKDDPAEKKRRADKAAKIKAAIKTSRAGAQFTATTRESANEVQEAGTATHKPNNGSDPEQGLSPNAKKEKARTSGVGVDANDSIAKSFKAFKAASKAAKQNGGRTPPGDKAIVKSTMAPAANQKNESVKLDEMIPAIAGLAVRAIAKKAAGKAMAKKSGSSDVAEKLGGMPAGLSKERIKADSDVYSQVLGIK